MLAKRSLKVRLIFVFAILVISPIAVLSSFNLYEFRKINDAAIASAKSGIRAEADKVLSLGVLTVKNDVERLIGTVEKEALNLSESHVLTQYVATLNGELNVTDRSVIDRVTLLTNSLFDGCRAQIELIGQSATADPDALTKKSKMIMAKKTVEVKVGKRGYAYVLDSKGLALVHPNPEQVGVNPIKKYKLKDLEPILTTYTADEVRFLNYPYQGKQKFVAYRYVPEWDWIICMSGYWEDLATDARQALISEMEQVVRNTILTVGTETGKIIRSIRYVDAAGAVVISATGDASAEVEASVKKNAWFEKLLKLQGGAVFNSGAVPAKTDGDVEMIVAAPVMWDHELKGFAVVSMNWTLVWDSISRYRFGDTGYAYITNELGVVVSHPKFTLTDAVNLTDPKYGVLSEIARTELTKGKEGIRNYEFEGMYKLVAYCPVTVGAYTYSVAACTAVAEYLASVETFEGVAKTRVNNLYKILTAGALLFAISGVLAGFFFSSKISTQIIGVIEGLKEGSAQLTEASGQIASASQELADAASTQAAGIEETSASMDMLSAMTRQNANHSNEANGIMQSAMGQMDQASQGVEALSGSMDAIVESSEKISKIIKTIDEIAFQTNLLALNAAVEAARAGEAGAGFAVVADEVRNLAMKAAEAAQSTSQIIDDTIRQIEGGHSLVADTGRRFDALKDNTERVNQLISEIAAASRDQAEKIQQVTEASSSMDQTTQKNAANAEEAASASEELNAQAQQMEHIIQDLIRIVDGANGSKNRYRYSEFTALPGIGAPNSSLIIPE